MLSSLKTYLSTQIFSNNTDSRMTDKSVEDAENRPSESENSNLDDEYFINGFRGNYYMNIFVFFLTDMMSLAKVSSKKIANELKNTAKQISEKVSRLLCHAYQFNRRYLPRHHSLNLIKFTLNSWRRGKMRSQ